MRIEEAPRNPRQGYLEARPGDVIGRDDLLLIDVRDERELTGGFGHIHGVLHVPEDRLRAEGLPGVSRETPLVVVCDNGRRSAVCARELIHEHGYREVYHLVGGMLRWTAEERPIAKAPTWVAPDGSVSASR
ncbi:MAG: rhodanese-like domain-containing protein [Polyangiales bacterium]